MGDEPAVSMTVIKEYIWTRYIENEDADVGIEENEILEFFRDTYTRVPIETDDDCFYFGVLMFEKAWEDPARKEEFFYLAREVFLTYREKTGETDWDAIEDRLTDIQDYFEEEGVDLASLAEKYFLPQPPVEERDELDEFREATPSGMSFIPPTAVAIPGDEEPMEVEAFYIDTYPVTVGEFQHFLDATQYRVPKYWTEKEFKEPGQPVIGVSYFDAEKYAEWSGKKIPTHSQWIAAARGSEEISFPWGSELDPVKVNCRVSDEEEGLESVGKHPEGISPSGVEDLVGGVWEWTDTWYDTEQEYKIIKGGSYVDPPSLLSIDTILYASPKEKIDNIGFRCTRPLSGVR